MNKHAADNVMVWACMAACETGTLVFIDDVNADRSSRRNCEAYRAILPYQIETNAAKLIGTCFTAKMDNDSKWSEKAT